MGCKFLLFILLLTVGSGLAIAAEPTEAVAPPVQPPSALSATPPPAEANTTLRPAASASHTAPVLAPRPEFFWQPRAQKTAFSFSYSDGSSTFTTRGPAGAKTADVTAKTQLISPMISFGMTDQWSLRIPLQYKSASRSRELAAGGHETLDSSGAADPALGLHYTGRSRRNYFHMGSTFHVNLGPIVQTTATQTGNNSNGGVQLVPYLGYSRGIGRSDFLGLRVQYTYNGDSLRANGGGADTLTTGGHSPSAAFFYELHGRSYYLSPQLIVRLIQASSDATSGRTVTNDSYSAADYTFTAGWYWNRDNLISLSGTETATSEIRTSSSTTPATNALSVAGTWRIEF